MSDRVEKILLAELSKTLGLPTDKIKGIENFTEHGMDSLEFALFISDIEDQLNIRFDSEELEFKKLKNYSSMKTFVEDKITKSKGDKNVSPLSP